MLKTVICETLINNIRSIIIDMFVPAAMSNKSGQCANDGQIMSLQFEILLGTD